jgi:hypothetical protein
VVARAAFRKPTLAMRVRDQLGEVFADGAFIDAFGIRGKPGISPGQLAMVTVLQFAENRPRRTRRPCRPGLSARRVPGAAIQRYVEPVEPIPCHRCAAPPPLTSAQYEGDRLVQSRCNRSDAAWRHLHWSGMTNIGTRELIIGKPF